MRKHGMKRDDAGERHRGR